MFVSSKTKGDRYRVNWIITTPKNGKPYKVVQQSSKLRHISVIWNRHLYVVERGICGLKMFEKCARFRSLIVLLCIFHKPLKLFQPKVLRKGISISPHTLWNWVKSGDNHAHSLYNGQVENYEKCDKSIKCARDIKLLPEIVRMKSSELVWRLNNGVTPPTFKWNSTYISETTRPISTKVGVYPYAYFPYITSLNSKFFHLT